MVAREPRSTVFSQVRCDGEGRTLAEGEEEELSGGGSEWGHEVDARGVVDLAGGPGADIHRVRAVRGENGSRWRGGGEGGEW